MSAKLSPQPPFSEALQIRAVKPGRFVVDFSPAFCFGTRAHGGLLISLAQKAASLHQPNHPHAIDLKIHFVHPAAAGEIWVDIADISAGKRTSLIELKASQHEKLLFIGLMHLGDLDGEKGVSFNVQWPLSPTPAQADISRLATNADPRWISYQTPWHPESYRRPQSYIKWFMPLDSLSPGYRDSWITPSDPSMSFKTEHLGFVGDMTLPILDDFCGDETSGSHAASIAAGIAQKRDRDNGVIREPSVDAGSFSTPITSVTLSYNMEIKKQLPAEGTRWLFSRSRARRILNGRMDNEISILDEGGDLVAVVQQVHQVIDLHKALGKTSQSKM